MIPDQDLQARTEASRQSILIVEDEALEAMEVEHHIRDMGYQVAGRAVTGEQALSLVAAHRPSLVLMDILLQGPMDGIEAAHRILEIANIPIVYITALADDETLSRARMTSPFGYLIKPFDARELRLTIEMALYKHRLENKLLESRRWLATTLNSIGDAVLTTDPKGLVRFLNPAAEALLECTGDEARNKPLAAVLRVLDEKTLRPVEHPALALLRGEPVPDNGGDMLLVTAREDKVPISGSVAPIVNDTGQFLGAVVVFRNIAHKKRAEEALLLSVSQLRQTLEETVSALAMMSEKRDLYTAGHQQRVARLACAVAEELGLSADRIEGLRVAGMLHDVGKIYVPAEILSKPALLTSMEMGIMKDHSEVGYEILKRVSFPWPVASIVRQHHERLDGSGYPDGLSGEEIMLEARILAVADVVEAMSSHRPYRAALGVGQALEEITLHKGTLYDTQAVEACVRLFRDRNFTFEAQTP